MNERRGRGTPRRACVLGASGGIGSALVAALERRGVEKIYAGSRRATLARSPAVTSFTFDFADEASLEEAATTIAAEGPLDLILVATGLLHRANAVRPEKSMRQLDPASLAELFHVNSIGPAIAAKHFLPHLARDGRAVMAFLSARVGSIGDNRLGGWYGYRASKAALNAFVRGFAIEASRMNRESIVVSLHPGTVDTRLSMPFQRGLAAGQLQRAEQSADHLLQVIERLTAEDSGGFFAWDGQRIAY